MPISTVSSTVRMSGSSPKYQHSYSGNDIQHDHTGLSTSRSANTLPKSIKRHSITYFTSNQLIKIVCIPTTAQLKTQLCHSEETSLFCCDDCN